jgi:hypothetical protein
MNRTKKYVKLRKGPQGKQLIKINQISRQFEKWNDLSDVKKESLIKKLIEASDDIRVPGKDVSAHPMKHLGIKENGIKKTNKEIKEELEKTVDDIENTDPKKLDKNPPSLTIFHNEEVMLSSLRKWFDEISIKKPDQKQSDLERLLEKSKKEKKTEIDNILLDMQEDIGTGYTYNKITKNIDPCSKTSVLKVFLKADQRGGFIIYDLYPECNK